MTHVILISLNSKRLIYIKDSLRWSSMGIYQKSRSVRASTTELDQVIAIALFLASIFSTGAYLCDALVTALRELKSMRDTVKRGSMPLDHQDLKVLARATNNILADVMTRADIVKFEMGRLTMKVPTSDYTAIMICKELLKSELQKRYGVDFLVKIKQ
jgi:hypothetical protein